MEPAISQEQLKAALIETLEERRDLLRDVVEEVVEEIAFTRAIAEGEDTENISRDEVFKLLEGQA
jgi:hypothetical protein